MSRRHKRQGRRAKYAALLIILSVLLLSGCVTRSSGSVSQPSRSGSTSPVDSRAQLGGPVRSVVPLEIGASRPKGRSLLDVYALQLLNQGSSPVVLDKVRLVADKSCSELRFAGAFVAPAGSNLGVVESHRRNLLPILGYKLLALKSTGGEAPVLVLRVGPALPGNTQGFRHSRNNSVSLYYHTAAGKRYVQAFPVRIDYPN